MSGLFNRFASCLGKTAYKIITAAPKRNMNLLECQSAMVLRDNGVTVPNFCVVEEGDLAPFDDFQAEEYVVKAQVLAGGRGKGTFVNGFQGGVHITKNRDEVKDIITKMLGQYLVTKQTTKAGVKCKKVMVAEKANIIKETYVCVLMDRSYNGPLFIISPSGGMSIEDVAKSTPELVKKVPFDITKGLSESEAKSMADFLQVKGAEDRMAEELLKLVDCFYKNDITMLEINPMCQTADNVIISVDAKLNFDDYAKFRQKEIFAMQDMSEKDPREIEAKKHDLNYVPMTGSIGCLVNGAGLAMATMDLLNLLGGSPANFLDVGGAVTKDQVQKALEIIINDKNVKSIFINIFGGIVDCVLIANGIIDAAKSINLTKPLIVRLEGTNAVEARNILRDSKLELVTAESFEEGAKKAVELAR